MPKLFLDYVGMGDSDKPQDYAYSAAERTDLVEAIWRDLSVQSRREELEELVLYHDVSWCHVRGHSDQDRCDGLAIAAGRRVKQAGGYCDAS